MIQENNQGPIRNVVAPLDGLLKWRSKLWRKFGSDSCGSWIYFLSVIFRCRERTRGNLAGAKQTLGGGKAKTAFVRRQDGRQSRFVRQPQRGTVGEVQGRFRKALSAQVGSLPSIWRKDCQPILN